jgi:hypothetical protein
VKPLVVMAALATSARAGTCPSRDTLDALADESWGGVSLRPRCTAIRADPRRLTFIVDVAAPEGKLPPRDFDPTIKGGYGYAAIVDESGTVLWRQHSYAETPGDWYDWQLVDLDGDGRDELVARDFHTGHMGTSSERLLIYVIGDGKLENVPPSGELLLGTHRSAKGDEQNSCRSTHRLVRDGRRTLIEIVGKRDTDPGLRPVDDGSCPKEGKQRYRWTGTGLVEK